MSGYNSRERRGLLVMLAIIVAFVVTTFMVRNCGGNRNGIDDSVKVTTVSFAGDSTSAKEKSSGRKTSKRKRSGGVKRNSNSKRIATDYPYRDILSDTIEVKKKEE